MKAFSLLPLLLATTLGLLPIARAQGPDTEALHEWTSKAGTSVTAQFVRTEGTMVVLKREDGRVLRLALAQLSEDSQALVKSLSAAPTPDGSAETEEKGEQLGESGETEYEVPLLESGKGPGRHAVFDAPTFTAEADGRGGVRIYLKENGAPAFGKGYAYLWPSLLYYPNGELQFRKIVKVEAKQKAVNQPKKLKFEGETDSGTKFEMTYEFDEEGVSLSGAVKDPKDIEEETVLRLGARFPRYQNVEPTMSLEAQKAVVKDSYIEAAPQEGENLRFDFVTRENLNGLDAVKKGLQWVKVKSVRCGEGVFKVTAPDLKYGTLRLWNSSSTPPYWGFGASLFRKDPGDDSADAKVMIGVE